ncbi:MAG: DUF6502 family protein [Caldimonas sp.]
MKSVSPKTAAARRPATAAAKKASVAQSGAVLGPAVLAAMASLVEPLATLAIARGVPFAALEDMLKAAFVAAARNAQPSDAGARIVSRVSTATGLTRREVTRLLSAGASLPPPRPSPATQVFTRWRADPAYRNRRGQLLAVPRQGPAPSFEALAHSVTQDVHPRSLLDELCRLGLVEVEGDTVRLVRDSVVGSGDSDRAYAFLAGNVGDHLRAAVVNVLADSPPHVEQAVFADELSEHSLAAFRVLAKAQWQTLLAATVPALQALVDADAASDRPRNRRVRIGLYTYHDVMAPGEPVPKARPRARKSQQPARKRAAAKDR